MTPPPQEPPDLIELTDMPLRTTAAVDFVTDPAAGGIALFLGTTRAENRPEGGALLALEYEAYPEMALSQMRDIASQARQRWPLARLALVHRVGLVAVGEPSVLVAVSAPHRAEAFDACRWLIDTLKAQVPIWKKEIWSNAQPTWVKGQPVGEDDKVTR